MAEQRIDPTAPMNPATPVGKTRRGPVPTGGSTETSFTAGSEIDQRSGLNPVTYVQQTASEMKKVIWPTRQDMVTYTIVVLLFLILAGALVFGSDWVGHWGIGRLFDLAG